MTVLTSGQVLRNAFFALMLIGLPLRASAQQFTVLGRDVQIHGSVQQGFIVSDGNDYLTMETSRGSAEMTDGAFNVSLSPTKKLRVGAQLYARNIGQLGNGHPEVDWAFGDYRFHSAFGVRVGKVKTVMGLFNDTQDMEFLYTWALLPQGVYPADLRTVSIAHLGGDVYGAVSLSKAGTLNYTAYAGTMSDDPRGGYRYGAEDAGYAFAEPLEKRGVGADVRWSSPIEGLTAGYSVLDTSAEAALRITAGPRTFPGHLDITTWKYHAVYGDFQRERLRVSAEWRSETIELSVRMPAPLPGVAVTSPATSWFVAGSYRLLPKLEIGTYRTQYVTNTNLPSASPDNHIYDTAVSARVDVTPFWHLKAEGHFMDGHGNPSMSRGFYARSNPGGLAPDTTMLVLRTGVSF